jgi:hypothetical protein
MAARFGAGRPGRLPSEFLVLRLLLVRLADVSTFARVRVRDFGTVDGIEGIPHTIDDVMTVWTQCTSDENPFVTVRIRGVINNGELAWLPEDAEVEVVEGPRFAGQPEDLITQARPIAAPEGSKGVMKTADGWPDLIWNSDIVHSPVQGWTDPEIAVEVLMCALAVAPEHDPDLRPMLLAALKARYAKLAKDPDTYPPSAYPWRGRTTPNKDMLEYLKG